MLMFLYCKWENKDSPYFMCSTFIGAGNIHLWPSFLNMWTFCCKNKLPVPGGPYRSTPFGWAMPRASNNSGCFTGSSITSLISLICLSRPPTISYVLSGTFSTIMSDTRGSTCSNQIQMWKYGSSLRTNICYVSSFISDSAYFIWKNLM